MMSKQFTSLSHNGVAADMIRAEVRCRDLGIALSGWQSIGAYTRGPIFAGVGGGSAPKRRRLNA